jgi:D-amino-acid oxidase
VNVDLVLWDLQTSISGEVSVVSHHEPEALVIGAGVCGLTTAICLAEAGLSTAIRTARLPGDSTSAAAGALWGQHLVHGEQVPHWSRQTLEVLRRLAADERTGVAMMTGTEVARTWADPPPELVDGLRACDPSELPAGFSHGWRYAAPVATMPVYLGYLLDRFERAGGQVTVDPVRGIAPAADGQPDARVMVNCTGVAARELVPDPAVVPVRGQVVLVANPGISEFVVAYGERPHEVRYLFPHGDVVLLGGTEEEGNWRLDPDPRTAEQIVRDCAAIDPRLDGARVVGHRVGLRPARPTVRLEAERLRNGRLLIHNYGHGGAGVSLSWGCAMEILNLIRAA